MLAALKFSATILQTEKYTVPVASEPSERLALFSLDKKPAMRQMRGLPIYEEAAQPAFAASSFVCLHQLLRSPGLILLYAALLQLPKPCVLWQSRVS